MKNIVSSLKKNRWMLAGIGAAAVLVVTSSTAQAASAVPAEITEALGSVTLIIAAVIAVSIAGALAFMGVRLLRRAGK